MRIFLYAILAAALIAAPAAADDSARVDTTLNALPRAVIVGLDDND